ncbi:MAG TPA: aryl-sulfate sulfotransferase [Gemmataceae bacterium]|nr:aryl-sulfate sulfotransferase [Gemmataceae bacterium]
MMRLFTFALIAFLILAASSVTAQDPAKKDAKAQPPEKKDKGPAPQASKFGVIVNDAKAYQGYTLYCPLSSTKAYLMDMNGKVVRTWEGASTPASSAYLLPNGNLFRPCVLKDDKGKGGGGGGPDGGRIQEFTWTGELVWDYKCTPDRRQHHDAIKLPNGNALMLAWDKKNAEQAKEAGRRGGGAVQFDSVVEVKQTGKTTGEIVWEWNNFDHLIQDFDKDKKNFGDVAAHPELVDINANVPDKGKGGQNDWTHINAISYHPEFDQIMLSVRHLNEIWIIDHSTTRAEAATHKGGKSGKGGDLLYRWGNPTNYRAGKASDQTSFMQHNAQWIPKGLPGAGNLLMFNNGNKRPGGEYSTVDEVVLPVDAKGNYTLVPGKAFGPAKAAWSYGAPKEFFSNFISGAQRLPNGNTLICVGASGTFMEVTPEKQLVWKYVNAVGGGKGGAGGPGGKGPGGPGGAGGKGGGGGGNVFRATRIAPDYAALTGRDLAPGLTVEELLLKDNKKGK